MVAYNRVNIFSYANSQVLAQYTGDYSTGTKYFYLHDRLGSVRQVIETDGDVVCRYTYNPYGELFDTPTMGAGLDETEETIDNPFTFTGQWYDSEINQYCLRARMYDPKIGRFTSRDPVLGDFKEPLTLHKYLYCINDPINRIDP
ncbi:MAG: RHS repeat-associated core domain-containing protein, partial [Planctomycetota bacterium]